MVTRRDSHVTLEEMSEAVKETINTINANSFQHFWEDGIIHHGARQEEISIIRRKILIAFGEISRNFGTVERSKLLEQCKKNISHEIAEAEIREFVRRSVFNDQSGFLQCKSLFFEDWLKKLGITEIMTTLVDYESILTEKLKEQDAYVSPEEINSVIKQWGTYQGRTIQNEQVRLWLNQFGENRNQRLMFKILDGLTYYTGDLLRTKMREAHGIVRRNIVHEIKEGKKKRNDIIVSYVDGFGKSGSSFAKLYADENQVYVTNIVENGKISSAIENNKDIKGLVFVDDFCGSGATAKDCLIKFFNAHRSLISANNIKVFFIAVTGFISAKQYIEDHLNKENIEINLHICDLMDDKDKCFSEDNKFFANEYERSTAKNIAQKIGDSLEKKAPLGFNDTEAAIVFESNCPNNTLPILWKESKNWIPLFKRQY